MTEAEIEDEVRRRANEANSERLWRTWYEADSKRLLRTWHEGKTGTMTDAMFSALMAAQMPIERCFSPKPTDPARQSKRKAQRRARAITRKAKK